jgi:hypothetical protein
MKSKMTRSDKKGMGCLILFALPFAGVGLFVGYLALSMLSGWVQVLGWQEVPARIHAVELIEHVGDDSTSYSVEAQYEYRFRGDTYIGDRVSLTDSADNIGSFHEDVYQELARYRDSGEPFRCFVNPDDPADSILYRDLRWGLLGLMLVFALVFGGVGFGFMIGAVVGQRIVTKEARLKADHPEEPWLWDHTWVGGRIKSGSKAKAIGITIFATLWNLISLPPSFLIWDELAAGNRIILLVLLFPLVGIFMAIAAGRMWLQYFRFSQSLFEMRRFPGVLGGMLQGHILTGMKAAPEKGVRLTLSCIRKESSGSGKNRSTSERVLWQETDLIDRAHLAYTPHGWRIPVELGIPYDAGPASSTDDDDESVFWRLEASAVLPGVDYEADFKVPIFKTDDSDPEFEREPRESSSVFSAAALEEELGAVGIHVESTPAGGRRIVFSRGRNLGAAIGLTIFLAIWTGAIWLMLHFGAPIIFPIFFGVFELLLLYGAVDLWLTRRVIEINSVELAYSKGIFGPGKQTVIPAHEIVSIKPNRGMQSGTKLYYQIEVRSRGDEKHTIATQIGSLQLTRSLINEIEDTLGE